MKVFKYETVSKIIAGAFLLSFVVIGVLGYTRDEQRKADYLESRQPYITEGQTTNE